jgi:hypothetical protein
MKKLTNYYNSNLDFTLSLIRFDFSKVISLLMTLLKKNLMMLQILMSVSIRLIVPLV